MKKLVLLLAVVASATLFSCSGNQAATTDTTAAEAENRLKLLLKLQLLLLTLLQLRLNKHTTVKKIRRRVRLDVPFFVVCKRYLSGNRKELSIKIFYFSGRFVSI